MNPANELVTIVDEYNRVIGSATRAEMRRKGLIHRATYILVFNSADELFIQKRTKTKDIYPGFYDVAAGGVVLTGESYEESAKRELFEELGIARDDLAVRFDYYHTDEDNRVWGRIFTCVHDGHMVLQKEEIESGEFLKINEVLAMSERQPFTPDGIIVLRKYLEMLNE